MSENAAGVATPSASAPTSPIVLLRDSVKLPAVEHCAHAFIWAPQPDVIVLGEFKPRAAVLTQLRFDGHIGFPGGMVDENLYGLEEGEAMELIIDALNRELVEEVNLNLAEAKVTKDTYIYSQFNDRKEKLVCHFFSLKVTMAQFEDIERRALQAKDFGDEVFGHLRAPLFTMEDGDRGFPAFLRNNFVGPSRTQLLAGLIRNEIFSIHEIKEVMRAKKLQDDMVLSELFS